MAAPLVLVVDDDASVRAVVVALLKKDGYDVMTTADERTALELFRSRQPGIDLLLTDVDMPGMNGIELAEAVLAEHPRVRVLLTSGKPIPAEHPRLPFLAKPFTPERLRCTVAALIAGPPPAAAGTQLRSRCERGDGRAPRARTA